MIRLATEDDLAQILIIYNDIILNTTAVYDYEPHSIEMRRDWFNTKKKQGFPVFVAEDDGKIVGLSSIGPFRNWAGYKYTVENSIYVDAAQRGKGIGKLLMPPIIEAAKNTPKTLKIRGKFPEILWNMRNPNTVFGAHDKIIWSI